MKNLIFSLIVAALSFGLGYWGANYSFWGGVPAAIFGFTICYFILMRRSFGKLSTLSQTAMSRMQGAQSNPDPMAQLDLIDQTITIFEEGFALGKEQFLIMPTLHAQIGTLQYQAAGLLLQLRLRETLQGSAGKASKFKSQASDRFAKSKVHLAASYKPWQVKVMKNWQPAAMLAVQEHREGNNDRALTILKEISGAGKDDPMFYGVYGWLLQKTGKSDEALLTVSEGTDRHKSHAPLKEMRLALQNRKSIDVFGFGQNWFAFFPEQLDRDMIIRMQSQMMANNPEHAQQFNEISRVG